jgi:hypothetical protein
MFYLLQSDFEASIVTVITPRKFNMRVVKEAEDILLIHIYVVFGGNNRKLVLTIWNSRRQLRSEGAKTPIEHFPLF